MVATLPWLDGVKPAAQGGGFAPIAGMEKVAGLLAQAKLEAEPLYRTWQVVSLSGLASDGEIEVRTRTGLKVIFGTEEDFFPQLARLDLLLDTGPPGISAINLALRPKEVTVSFANTGAASAPPDRPCSITTTTADAALLVSHRYDLVRFWNSGAACSFFTMAPDRKQALVHLLFYAARGPDSATVRIAGRYRAARASTVDDPKVANLAIEAQGDAVEVHLPQVSQYVALELDI